MVNKRMWYGVRQVQIAPDNTAAGGYTATHVIYGLQSAGSNVTFNLEEIFELGQSEVYEQVENVPDVELTMEKVIDSKPLIWHKATPTATSATLVGRGSNQKCQALFTLYDDTKDSASGTPLTEVEHSGLFVSQLQYTIPVEGNVTESVTLVGNHRKWRSSPSGTGFFTTNTDSPSGIGILRRQDIVFGSGAGKTILPPRVRGISGVGGGTGYNVDTSGVFGASIQNIRISANLGRENMFELGRKLPYHRYLGTPVEVLTEIEVMTKDGDFVDADPELDNTADETIDIRFLNNFRLNLGSKNRLNSVSVNGGDAARGAANMTMTYNYRCFNQLTVIHSGDPAGVGNP